jgi:hypothetical protein
MRFSARQTSPQPRTASATGQASLGNAHPKMSLDLLVAEMVDFLL